ncbi:unnamed protein product [Calypogeia fissa]
MFYWIKLSTQEGQPFDPFLILGLEATATDGDIKKAYRSSLLRTGISTNSAALINTFTTLLRATEGGGNLDGVAPVLQLPQFKDVVIKRLVRKKVRCLQDLRDLRKEDREDVLTSVGGLSNAAADDVQAVLETMPSISLDVVCETEGEEDQQLNRVWVSQRLTFMDVAAAGATASKLIGEGLEGTGVDDAEVKPDLKAAVERVKGGSRLAIKKFQAPKEGTYNLTAFCSCDIWIGLDKFNVKLKVGKRSRAEPSPKIVAEDDETANYNDDGLRNTCSIFISTRLP